MITRVNSFPPPRVAHATIRVKETLAEKSSHHLPRQPAIINEWDLFSCELLGERARRGIAATYR